MIVSYYAHSNVSSLALNTGTSRVVNLYVIRDPIHQLMKIFFIFLILKLIYISNFMQIFDLVNGVARSSIVYTLLQ